MSNQVTSIIGTTATGKTEYALSLASELVTQGKPVEIVSVDSRQIYTGIEVLSGADVPSNFTLVQESGMIPVYVHDELDIRLHGISMLAPDQDWSLAHFQTFLQTIILQHPDSELLLVGGTGLYHQYAFRRDVEYDVAPNQYLRDQATTMSLKQLQDAVKEADPEKFAALNNSDLHNPTRLVRAWEITVAETIEQPQHSDEQIKWIPDTHQFVGLRRPFSEVEQRIKTRVEDRWNDGAIQEVEELIAKNINLSKNVRTATGFAEIQAFLAGTATKEQAQEKWYRRERKYAKRQETWWKKQPDIQWIDV